MSIHKIASLIEASIVDPSVKKFKSANGGLYPANLDEILIKAYGQDRIVQQLRRLGKGDVAGIPVWQDPSGSLQYETAHRRTSIVNYRWERNAGVKGLDIHRLILDFFNPNSRGDLTTSIEVGGLRRAELSVDVLEDARQVKIYVRLPTFESAQPHVVSYPQNLRYTAHDVMQGASGCILYIDFYRD